MTGSAEAAAVGDGTGRNGEARAAVETRTRGEAHADPRQADPDAFATAGYPGVRAALRTRQQPGA